MRSNRSGVATVKVMRILCPLNLIFTAVIGYANYRCGNAAMTAPMGVCFGVTMGLTFVQWCVFEINPRRSNGMFWWRSKKASCGASCRDPLWWTI